MLGFEGWNWVSTPCTPSGHTIISLYLFKRFVPFDFVALTSSTLSSPEIPSSRELGIREWGGEGWRGGGEGTINFELQVPLSIAFYAENVFTFVTWDKFDEVTDKNISKH